MMKQTNNNYFTEQEYKLLQKYRKKQYCTQLELNILHNLKNKLISLGKNIINELKKDEIIIQPDFCVCDCARLYCPSTDVGLVVLDSFNTHIKTQPNVQVEHKLSLDIRLYGQGLQISFSSKDTTSDPIKQQLYYSQFLKNNIIKGIQNLQGHCIKFNHSLICRDLSLDELELENIEELISCCDLYRKCDEKHKEFYTYFYTIIPKKDSKLTESQIVNCCYKYIKLLYSMYDVYKLSWEVKNNEANK